MSKRLRLFINSELSNSNLNMKGKLLDYVLVANVVYPVPNYYSGYWNKAEQTEGIIETLYYPVGTYDYTKAMKIAYKDEAQTICDEINNQMKFDYYRVEEHCYC